ncbi:MAG: hypothetical protein ACQESP_06985, partial [Candidatus Muiribacteriota bacterium]
MNKKGFTIAEIVITMVLLTIVIGPLMTAFMVSLRSTESVEEDFNMDVLAEELMQEIMNKHYEDPVYYGNIGLEAGETDRADFNDVDDYLGYKEDFGEIQDAYGNILTQYEEYSRKVDIFNEHGDPLKSEDGLEFIEENLTLFPQNVSRLKISRDGNRLFGIDAGNERLFVGNPFSNEIEAEYNLEENPRDLEIAPDSRQLYLAYNDKIEVYTYEKGEFSFSNVFGGMDFGQISGVEVIEGQVSLFSDKGIFINEEEVGNFDNVHFLESSHGKTFIGHGSSIAIVENTDFSNTITNRSIGTEDTINITSSFYDIFNNIVYFTVEGENIRYYDFNEESWGFSGGENNQYINALVYSYPEGEFYAGGENADSAGIMRSRNGRINFGNATNLDPSAALMDLFLDEKHSRVIMLEKESLHSKDFNTSNLQNDVWTTPEDISNLKLIVDYEDIFILTDGGIYKLDREDYTQEGFFPREGIKDFTVDNSRIYFTDGVVVRSVNRELSDETGFNIFSNIEEIQIAKDGKTLYMSAPTTNRIYFLDTFNGDVGEVEKELEVFDQSSSGNTLISYGNSQMTRSRNNIKETLSSNNSYEMLVNIDKEDMIYGIRSDGAIDVYEYQDGFGDDFSFISGYNLTSFGMDKGFNFYGTGSELVLDTGSVIDDSDDTNTGTVILYKTFVFPIPKYLREMQVDLEYSFTGNDLEIFVLPFAAEQEYFDKHEDSLAEAAFTASIGESSTINNFNRDITNLPPTNMLTVGFKFTDTDNSSKAEFVMDNLEINFNPKEDFKYIKTIDTPVNNPTKAALSWDNRFLYIASYNNFYTYDIENERFVERKALKIPNNANIQDLEVSTDNNTIFAATDKGLYSITEPLKKKIVKLTVEKDKRNVPPTVIYATASNWETRHGTNVIPHIVNREIIYTDDIFDNKINENTIWYPDKQYVVNGNLQITNGASLVIMPGTNVKFTSNSKINVTASATLTAINSLITSSNDHSSGAYLSGETDELETGFYRGIYIEPDANIIINGTQINYALTGIDKEGSSITEIENTSFINNTVGVNLSQTGAAIEIKACYFEENEFDIMQSNSPFPLTLTNNYFINAENRSVDIKTSNGVLLNTNHFYGGDTSGDAFFNNSGFTEAHNNLFSGYNGVIELSNTEGQIENNTFINGKNLVKIRSNEENRKFFFMNNKFINSQSLFNFNTQGTLTPDNFRAFMNYFINSSGEINNPEGFNLDFRGNYWGNEVPDEEALIQKIPFVFYGDLEKNVTIDNKDFFIRHFLRVQPGNRINLQNLELNFFSEYILPYIDIMRLNAFRGKLNMDNVKIKQEENDLIEELFENTNLTFTSLWNGINVFGEINAVESYFSNGINYIKLFNGSNYGSKVEELVFNEFNLNTNDSRYGILFTLANSGITDYKYEIEKLFFNKFLINDLDNKKGIFFDNGISIPEEDDKISMKYNYLGTNNPPLNGVYSQINTQMASIFPWSLYKTVESDIYIEEEDDFENTPLAVLGDIDLRATINFNLEDDKEPGILFATDSGITSDGGGIYTNDNPVLISHIKELNSPYDDYRDFDYWGGSDSDMPGEIVGLQLQNQSSYNLHIKYAKTRIETVLEGVSLEDNIQLEFENSRVANLESASSGIISDGIKKEININNTHYAVLDGEYFNFRNLTNNALLIFDKSDFGQYTNDFFENGLKQEPLNYEAEFSISYGEVENNTFSGDIEIKNSNFYNFPGIKTRETGGEILIEESRFLNSANIITAEKVSHSVNIKNSVFGDETEPEYTQRSIADIKYSQLSQPIVFDFIGNKLYIDNNISDYSDYIKLESRDQKNGFDIGVKAGENLFVTGNTNLNSYFNFGSSGTESTFFDTVMFYNNMFLNSGSASTKVAYLSGIKNFNFDFNHVENTSPFQFVLNSLNNINITNNNLNDYFSDELYQNYSAYGNYYNSSDSSDPLALSYNVDITKRPSFVVKEYEAEEVYNLNRIVSENYISIDKQVKIEMSRYSGDLDVDFGDYTSKIDTNRTSFTADMDRTYQYPSSIEPDKIVSPLEEADYHGYFELVKTGDSNYEGDFYINHNGLSYSNQESEKDHEHIVADWNDRIDISVPITGKINPEIQHPLPETVKTEYHTSSDPQYAKVRNSFPIIMPMPDAPQPPLEFSITSISAPSVVGSKSYEFDGMVNFTWENNQSNSAKVHRYNVYLYNTSDVLVDNFVYSLGGDTEQVLHSSHFSNVDPGEYYIKVEAVNNSPYEGNPRLNDPGNVIGDNRLSCFKVHSPPQILVNKLDYKHIETEYGVTGTITDNFLVEEKTGANRYQIRYSRNPDGSNVEGMTTHNSNIIPGSVINITTPGIYYFQARAGYAETNSSGEVSYQEYTDWSESKPVWLATDNVVGVVINHDTPAPGSTYKDMLLFARLLKSNHFLIDDNLTVVLIEDYQEESDGTPILPLPHPKPIIDDILLPIFIQDYQEELENYELDDLTYLTKEDYKLINDENFDALFFSSTRKLSKEFLKQIGNNYSNSIMAKDRPGIHSSIGYKTKLLNELGITTAPTTDSNPGEMKYKDYHPISAGINTDAVWDPEYSGRYISSASPMGATTNIHSTVGVLQTTTLSSLDSDQLDSDGRPSSRRVFLNYKWKLNEFDETFYEDTHEIFGHKVTRGEILKKAMKWVLNGSFYNLEDIKIAYYDYDKKRDWQDEDPTDKMELMYEKHSTTEGHTLEGYEVDGNLSAPEDLPRIVPYLRWEGDPEVVSYQLFYGDQEIPVFGDNEYHTEWDFIIDSGVSPDPIWQNYDPADNETISFRLHAIGGPGSSGDKTKDIKVHLSGSPDIST